SYDVLAQRLRRIPVAGCLPSFAEQIEAALDFEDLEGAIKSARVLVEAAEKYGWSGTHIRPPRCYVAKMLEDSRNDGPRVFKEGALSPHGCPLPVARRLWSLIPEIRAAHVNGEAWKKALTEIVGELDLARSPAAARCVSKFGGLVKHGVETGLSGEEALKRLKHYQSCPLPFREDLDRFYDAIDGLTREPSREDLKRWGGLAYRRMIAYAKRKGIALGRPE
ncbi:MAG: hypothetical protein AAFX50_10805, partial [Acidobacteriota bacterium]